MNVLNPVRRIHKTFEDFAFLRIGVADSFGDHGRFFHQNPRYAAALAARDDPKEFARAINRAGYATDPAYSAKLIGFMDRFNLYAYDEAS